MGHCWIIPPAADVIEPVVAPTIYANGKLAVEWMGNGDVCFHVVQRQLPLEAANGQPQSIVVAHIIKPITHLPMMVNAAAECLQWHLCRHAQICPVCPDRPPPHGGPLRVVGS